MKEFDFDFEVNNSINYLNKGQTPIQIRRDIIEKGIPQEFATKISKEAHRRFLQNNSKSKIKRGLIWLGGGILASIILWQIGNKFSYVAIFGSIWGLFRIFSGITEKRIASKMIDENS